MISIPTIQLLSMDVAYPSLRMIRSIVRLTLSYSESMKLSRNRHTEFIHFFQTPCINHPYHYLIRIVFAVI